MRDPAPLVFALAVMAFAVLWTNRRRILLRLYLFLGRPKTPAAGDWVPASGLAPDLPPDQKALYERYQEEKLDEQRTLNLMVLARHLVTCDSCTAPLMFMDLRRLLSTSPEKAHSLCRRGTDLVDHWRRAEDATNFQVFLAVEQRLEQLDLERKRNENLPLAPSPLLEEKHETCPLHPLKKTPKAPEETP